MDTKVKKAPIEIAEAQMRKGVLELCILSIIAEGEAYPSDILKKLKASKMIVVEGTIYPLLSRLKNAGFLSYQWKESKIGPPRKYFKITTEGKAFQAGLHKNWLTLSKAVDSACKPKKKVSTRKTSKKITK